MTADVVVVAWRSAELIGACLEALEAEDPAHRTIVVDNASGDGTVELVRERFPSVELVELERNVGFGRAVNLAVARGSGEAVVLVNPDLRVEPGFLGAIVAPLADERVGMVAGMTLFPDSQVVESFGIELDRGLAAYNRLRHRRPGEPAGRLAGPSGGAAAYRRSAFEAAGGFDEALFAYGEDVDLALRLRAAGWRAAEAPGARGEHVGGASVGFDSPLQRDLAAFARGYLLRRYGVLRSRAAPRALAMESAVVAWGLLRHRTAVPLAGRVRGWRAGRGERRPIPPGTLDETIGALEALRRLVRAR